MSDNTFNHDALVLMGALENFIVSDANSTRGCTYGNACMCCIVGERLCMELAARMRKIDYAIDISDVLGQELSDVAFANLITNNGLAE